MANEFAKASGLQAIEALLDLVKAFERIRHSDLIAAAKKHSYPLWLLRLSLDAYRMDRTIRVGHAHTRLRQATRGITAGSAFATVELHLLLYSMIAEMSSRWPRCPAGGPCLPSACTSTTLR